MNFKHLLFLLLASFFISTAFAQASKLTFKKTASGLEYAFVERVNGDKVKKEFRVFVNYTTRIVQDRVFDDNSKLGKPYSFIFGQEDMLKGWEEAVSLLRIGDSAHFRIPSALAYGEKKLGSIPANTTLLLEIRIVKVERAFFSHVDSDTISYANGLTKILVDKGAGKEVKPFTNVTLAFTAYILNSRGFKRVFQSSLTNSELAIFQLGAGRMLPGLDVGVATMKIGEKSSFIIPPHLGFGNEKAGIVPGNSTLYYDIELINSTDPFWKPVGVDTLFGKNGVMVIPTLKKSGEYITLDNIVTFHYTGYFVTPSGNSIIFGNTIERKRPVTIRPGSNSSLPGFKEGFVHLKKGEKAIFYIPDSMAFGGRSSGIIPPHSDISYQIEILDVQEYPYFNVKGLDSIKMSSGLQYIEVRKNDTVKADSGNFITISYTGFLMDSLGNKIIFDTSRERGSFLDFVLGVGKVIKGFDEGIIGMAVGDGRRLIIPASLGYGEEGMAEAGIPANATLYFDVELLAVKKTNTDVDSQERTTVPLSK